MTEQKNGFTIKYLYTKDATKVIQGFWENIKTVLFFNMKYMDPSDTETVAIWTIKLKNIQPC